MVPGEVIVLSYKVVVVKVVVAIAHGFELKHLPILDIWLLIDGDSRDIGVTYLNFLHQRRILVSTTNECFHVQVQKIS